MNGMFLMWNVKYTPYSYCNAVYLNVLMFIVYLKMAIMVCIY